MFYSFSFVWWYFYLLHCDCCLMCTCSIVLFGLLMTTILNKYYYYMYAILRTYQLMEVVACYYMLNCLFRINKRFVACTHVLYILLPFLVCMWNRWCSCRFKLIGIMLDLIGWCFNKYYSYTYQKRQRGTDDFLCICESHLGSSYVFPLGLR